MTPADDEPDRLFSALCTDGGDPGAGAFRIRRRRGRPLTFNSTAMTDVIFILLVFFVSISQVRTSSVELDLPAVSAGAAAVAAPDQTLVVVDIDRDGQVFLDGAPIGAARVGQIARGAGGDVKVRIRADDQTRNGVVMRVVASLADVGIHAIEFAVDNRGS
jgi:biopolymer transport protein ExbD